MTFKQWLRQLFSPRVQVSRASSRGKSRQRSRHGYVPRVEELEVRLAPTVSLSYDTSDFPGTTIPRDALTITGANSSSAAVTIGVLTVNNQLNFETFGDVITSLPAGFSYVIPNGTNTSFVNTTNPITSIIIGGPGSTNTTPGGGYGGQRPLRQRFLDREPVRVC